MCDIGHVQKPEVLSNQSYFFSEIISTSPQMAGLEEGIANFVKLGLSRVKIQVTLVSRRPKQQWNYFVVRQTHILDDRNSISIMDRNTYIHISCRSYVLFCCHAIP